MIKLILFLFFAISMALPAQAAFRIHKAKSAQTVANARIEGTAEYSSSRPVTAAGSGSRLIPNPDDRYSITAEGVFSLACAGFCIVSLIALSATSFSFFVIPAVIFGAAAVVFGAIGLHRTRKANAIIGMTLGFIGIIAALVAAAGL